MVRRIYEQLDLAFTPDFEANMRRFLAENAADKHGTHRYSLHDGGLDPDRERRRFAFYQKRFAVPAEPVT